MVVTTIRRMIQAMQHQFRHGRGEAWYCTHCRRMVPLIDAQWGMCSQWHRPPECRLPPKNYSPLALIERSASPPC
jgi:hypothetical protein